jgi:HPt (histidine-containing phosphotransfer) domain-containing protein
MGTMNEHSGFFKLENEDELDALQEYDHLIQNHFSNNKESLTNLIHDWWDDVFTGETSIQDLIDRIEKWLPKEQSAVGSQNVDVEFLVDGFNDCLHKIKSKLR